MPINFSYYQSKLAAYAELEAKLVWTTKEWPEKWSTSRLLNGIRRFAKIDLPTFTVMLNPNPDITTNEPR